MGTPIEPRAEQTSDDLWYLLFSPEERDGKVPLIVFLHGVREGGGTEETLSKVATHCLPHLAKADDLPRVKKEEHGEEEPFPFLIACPQTPKSWPDEKKRIGTLLGKLVEEEQADPDHLYLTGVSSGAVGCWELALHEPSPYAAILPISWDVSERAREVKSAVWVILGKQDSEMEKAHHSVEDARTKLFKDRPEDDETHFNAWDGDHNGDFWNRVYARSDIYEWMLRHSRPH